ncbi:hypothetical protein PNOK_0796200 [Pyrrhoderma noxium]|uniref:Uncharacterized protein n=1 Tax=Pyrrhoderma noxium TaxID=2282107 RepID=A0A286U9S8_9AGAM|nr:hypothetical protein PNOK_0796200 [Pyrrhoderma noxium]
MKNNGLSSSDDSNDDSPSPRKTIDLTDDLWYLIFLRTLPSRPCFSPHDSPQLLTQVCRRWRQIAISSPLLWSTISLPPTSQSLTLGALHMFKLWLQRSSSCLLDIDLRNTNDILPWTISFELGELELYQELHDTLMCHKTRIRTLLRGYNQHFYNNIRSDTFPELVELFIVDPPEGKVCSPPVINLPSKLKSFSTFNTYNHFNPATRWPQLEHLEIWQTDNALAGLSIDDCLSILNQLPSLRSTGLYISVDDDTNRSSSFQNTVTLPNLQKLLISSLQVNISRLLSSISAPVLEVSGFDGCASAEFFTVLPDFFRQCSKTITFVALGQIGVVNVSLLASLAELPLDVTVAACSSSFDGHAFQRAEGQRRSNPTQTENPYDCSLSNHLLSIAYTSPEMWFENHESSESYHFPARTFRDYAMWNPTAPRPARSAMELAQQGSVQVSICKGNIEHHSSFIKTFVS